MTRKERNTVCIVRYNDQQNNDVMVKIML